MDRVDSEERRGETTTIAGALVTGGPIEGESIAPGALLADRYVAVECVGAGGMGEVWRGYDVKLERIVALKFLRARSPDAVAETRLVNEARAMARLSHPNVVPVYDVVSADARLFIVMQYVEGATLHEWWTRDKRSTREILAAMHEAAKGLAAAHAAGFVHRDFKPANVLVGSDGRVRVTDFGLVRGGESSSQLPPVLSESELARGGDELTAHGIVLGTPAYMSPEQRDGRSVDARSDQYSFCVAMYEALHGVRPPAVRTSTAAEHGSSTTLRITAPVSMPVRRMIVRGLALDPADRFPTMEPILAVLEAEVSGRARRRVIAFAGIAAAALGVLTWQGAASVRVAADRQACAQQAAAIHTLWQPPTRRNVEQAFVGTRMSYAGDSFERTARWIDGYVAAWHDERQRSCLAARSGQVPTQTERLVADCFDERRVALEAVVEVLSNANADVVADALDMVSDLPAISACTDPVWLAKRTGMPEDPQLQERFVELRQAIAAADAEAGSGRHDEVRRRAARLIEDADGLGVPQLRVQARSALASAIEESGDYAGARAVLEDAYVIAGESADDELAAGIATRLVYLFGYRDVDFASARLWGRLAQMRLDRLGIPDHPGYAPLANNLALVHNATGDFPEAIAFAERALVLYRQAHGPEHPSVALASSNLGFICADAGDHARAFTMLRAALALREAQLGPDHPQVAWTLNNLGNLHATVGEHEQAAAMLERAVTIFEGAYGPEHPDLAMALVNLAAFRYGRGELEAAREPAARGLAIMQARLGADHPNTMSAQHNFAVLQMSSGDLAAAEQKLRAVVDARARVLGTEHPDLAAALVSLGILQVGQGDLTGAEASLRRALPILERHVGRDHLQIVNVLARLGAIGVDLGEVDDAIADLERAIAGYAAQSGPIDPQLVAALSAWGRAREAQGDASDAIAAYELAIAIADGVDAPPRAEGVAAFALAKQLWADGRDRPRALALAQRARDRLAASTTTVAPTQQDIDAWLALHEPRARSARGLASSADQRHSASAG